MPTCHGLGLSQLSFYSSAALWWLSKVMKGVLGSGNTGRGVGGGGLVWTEDLGDRARRAGWLGGLPVPASVSPRFHIFHSGWVWTV